jgi:hypothetical protein
MSYIIIIIIIIIIIRNTSGCLALKNKIIVCIN